MDHLGTASRNQLGRGRGGRLGFKLVLHDQKLVLYSDAAPNNRYVFEPRKVLHLINETAQ